MLVCLPCRAVLRAAHMSLAARERGLRGGGEGGAACLDHRAHPPPITTAPQVRESMRSNVRSLALASLCWLAMLVVSIVTNAYFLVHLKAERAAVVLGEAPRAGPPPPPLAATSYSGDNSEAGTVALSVLPLPVPQPLSVPQPLPTPAMAQGAPAYPGALPSLSLPLA